MDAEISQPKPRLTSNVISTTLTQMTSTHREAFETPESTEKANSSDSFDSSDNVRSSKTTPPTKILYRYLHKDSEGDIIDKRESPYPIEFQADDSATGLSDQTVLEILTTRISKSQSDKSAGGSGKLDANTVMKIHSIYLINALREVIKYYPSLSLRAEPVTISEPYRPLVHYMTELEEYKTNHPPGHDDNCKDITNSHIDILLGFLDHTLGKQLRQERERHRQPTPVVTFEFLWLLFKPGQDVYFQDPDDNTWSGRVVAELEGGVLGPNASPKPYQIHSWNVRSLEGKVQPTRGCTQIDIFDGEKDITSLAVFPKHFHSEDAKLEARFVERGKKYWSMCRLSYKEYRGTTVTVPATRYATSDRLPFTVNGKIMVDFFSFEKYCYKSWEKPDLQLFKSPVEWSEVPADGCDCTPCRSRLNKIKISMPIVEYQYIADSEIEQIKNDYFYFLCDYKLGGWALNERNWGLFHIDYISDPQIEEDPFQYLVLDPEIKITIESLVWNFAQSGNKVKSWNAEFIRHKGDGRIFLLHGSPGVGKTCTAECVSDLIGRPLLPLTCGDMGIEADVVERNFKRYFELGERWGAVVLMDEADVYLEQRTPENLARNSLVSVFLRCLEYFRGILFLTTNRVGSFDDAFISRIHVALHYERLNEEQRHQIWSKNFRRLQREERVEIDPDTFFFSASDPELKAVEWNGREIRNAFQTAVALAQYEARKAGKDVVTLRPEHLKSVVMMSKQFKDYITSTHKNQDETKRAMIEERRNDTFRARK